MCTGSRIFFAAPPPPTRARARPPWRPRKTPAHFFTQVPSAHVPEEEKFLVRGVRGCNKMPTRTSPSSRSSRPAPLVGPILSQTRTPGVKPDAGRKTGLLTENNRRPGLQRASRLPAHHHPSGGMRTWASERRPAEPTAWRSPPPSLPLDQPQPPTAMGGCRRRRRRRWVGAVEASRRPPPSFDVGSAAHVCVLTLCRELRCSTCSSVLRQGGQSYPLRRGSDLEVSRLV